jgi:molybdopterin-guanine dinucleotide biosynthesis adapter protein
MADPPELIQVVGTSGSGKTLVVERATRALKARGLEVAVVKHSHHAPDLRGKDSARAWAAGASLVVFDSRPSFMLFRELPAGLLGALPVDVVLIEGYSSRRMAPSRLRVRSPADAPRVVRKILSLAPSHRPRPTLRLDGRRTSADTVWRFVLGVMRARGVREVREER